MMDEIVEDTAAGQKTAAGADIAADDSPIRTLVRIGPGQQMHYLTDADKIAAEKPSSTNSQHHWWNFPNQARVLRQHSSLDRQLLTDLQLACPRPDRIVQSSMSRLP